MLRAMGVAVQQAESLNLTQIEVLLDGCESVSFQGRELF